MNLSDAQLYALTKRVYPVAVNAVNLMPGFTVQYKGSKLYASVAVASSDLLFKADDTNGTTTADTNVSTDGTIDLSTPAAAENTLGEIVDIMNAGDWLCMVNAGLRADAVDDRYVELSAAQAKVAAGLKIYQDEGVTPFKLGFSITNRKFTSVGVWDTDIDYINALHYLDLHLTATGGATIKIYEISDGTSRTQLQNNVTETLLATYSVATATAYAQKFSLDMGGPITASLGKRLYVDIAGAAAVSMPSPSSVVSYVRAVGSTTRVA